jgi:hypothetical protein
VGSLHGAVRRMSTWHRQGNIHMILEVAIFNVRPGESADFERTFAEAQAIIAARPGYGWGVQWIVEAD